jgi:hypothetical protein
VTDTSVVGKITVVRGNDVVLHLQVVCPTEVRRTRWALGVPKRNRAASTACYQLRQLGDIAGDPSRLILAEQLGR